MFFVSGITGNVGGAAARKLLAEGKAVRTLARSPEKAAEWSKQGVDVRKDNFEDAAALTAALADVEGAFLMIPPLLAPSPGFTEAKAIIASLQKVLADAPPPRVVALSSIGSEQTSGLGLITTTHLLEESLRDAPFPTAFVRAGSFLENFAGGFAAAGESGIFYSFYQPVERAVPMIATVDIGNEIAKLLTDKMGWTGNRIVELGSPASPNDIAQAMSKALGKPVRAQAIPRDRWAATLGGFGMQPGTTGAYEEMTDGVNSGWIHFGVPGTQSVAATISPMQFFQQLRQS